jgi:hypothetical protein
MNDRQKNDKSTNKWSTQKLEQHEHHCKLEVNSGASEGSAVYVPLVTPAMLLLLQTRMKKEPDCGYDKRNMFVVICYTDIRNG